MPWIIVVAIAAFVGFDICSAGPGGAGTDDPRVGREAPGFTLRVLDEPTSVSLAEHRGKVVLIDFWATYCGPCRRTMPHMQSLHQNLPASDFVLLSVNVDQPATDRERLVRDFMNTLNLSFPVLIDNGRTAYQYEARRIPLVVLVDRQGTIRHVFQGYTEPNAIDRAIDDLIREPSS